MEQFGFFWGCIFGSIVTFILLVGGLYWMYWKEIEAEKTRKLIRENQELIASNKELKELEEKWRRSLI